MLTTEPQKPMSATDSGIAAMYRYLKSKVSTGSKLTDAAGELYALTNHDSLSYFEIMFKTDLERLGLI